MRLINDKRERNDCNGKAFDSSLEHPASDWGGSKNSWKFKSPVHASKSSSSEGRLSHAKEFRVTHCSGLFCGCALSGWGKCTWGEGSGGGTAKSLYDEGR